MKIENCRNPGKQVLQDLFRDNRSDSVTKLIEFTKESLSVTDARASRIRNTQYAWMLFETRRSLLPTMGGYFDDWARLRVVLKNRGSNKRSPWKIGKYKTIFFIETNSDYVPTGQFTSDFIGKIWFGWGEGRTGAKSRLKADRAVMDMVGFLISLAGHDQMEPSVSYVPDVPLSSGKQGGNRPAISFQYRRRLSSEIVKIP